MSCLKSTLLHRGEARTDATTSETEVMGGGIGWRHWCPLDLAGDRWLPSVSCPYLFVGVCVLRVSWCCFCCVWVVLMC